MPDIDERLDELQSEVDAGQAREKDLGGEIAEEARKIPPPPAPPDHAGDGGII